MVKTLVILRRYFLYDRSLLLELSRCAWEALRVFFVQPVSQKGTVLGMFTATQQKCLSLAFIGKPRWSFAIDIQLPF